MINSVHKIESSFSEASYGASKNRTFKRPSITVSQRRLHGLTEHYDIENTNIPGLNELRPGYFDPIYLKKSQSKRNRRRIDDDLDGKSEKLHGMTVNRKTQSSTLTQRAISMSNKTIKDLLNIFSLNSRKSSESFIGVLRIFIGYLISIILCINSTSGRWLGPQRTIVPLIVTIFHPSHSVGTQIEMSILAELGVICGGAVSVLAIFLSSLSLPSRTHYGGIFAVFLFLCIFLLQLLRLEFNRSYYFCITTGIILIYCLTSFPGMTTFINDIGYLQFFKNSIIPSSMGICLTLLINLMVCPRFDHKRLIFSYIKTLSDIKGSILETVGSNVDKQQTLSKNIDWSLITLSENLREYSNELLKITLFESRDLEQIRNCINLIVSPLKSIPYPISLLTPDCDLKDHIHSNLYTKIISSDLQENYKIRSLLDLRSTSENQYDGDDSLSHARPDTTTGPPSNSNLSREYYLRIFENQFKNPALELLISIVACIELSQICLIKYARINITPGELVCDYGFNYDMTNAFFSDILQRNQDIQKEDAGTLLLLRFENTINYLKRNLQNLDITYKKYTNTHKFCDDLLVEREITRCFLFLRYHRQISKLVIFLSHIILKICSKESCLTNGPMSRNFFPWSNWKFNWIDYPMKKALLRLPKQCLRDRGKLTVFSYFQVSNEVDQSFEKIYNMNTSRTFSNMNSRKSASEGDIIRAISHTDYNKQLFLEDSDKSKIKHQIWRLAKKITSGTNSKNSFKNAFLIIMTSLPILITGFDEESHYPWYVNYHCYWCPVLTWVLYSSTSVFSIKKMAKRCCAVIIAGLWALCCCESVFKNSFKGGKHICLIFSALIAFPSMLKFHVYPTESRIGLVSLSVFSLILLDTYDDSESSNLTAGNIWNICWSISASALVAVISTIMINILIWPFIARNQVTKSFGKLLLNLSQCYQIVNDRYVYRDADDPPTELTLTLSTIRETRVLEHLYAVRNLIKSSISEANIINISVNINHYYNRNSEFYFKTVEKILESCYVILNKIIEARINAVQFTSWIKDNDILMSKKLLPLRRDSAVSIIFNFYLVANCFQSENRIPNYLPSMLSLRKRLYDEMSIIKNSMSNLNIEKTNKITEDVHWTEIHAIAFSKSITDIVEELDKIIDYSKIILGEQT
ncbi:Bre4 protein [Saccharomycopsis crataegensis]|uniref:Bre4 protein n=1 Tax=Saccharomycopsis crataegensis TaxID=43959 RepID=A0AAV5QUF3_9ASCO|nr:Bre4 protein [Saccharomycopsis crataegensis]